MPRTFKIKVLMVALVLALAPCKVFALDETGSDSRIRTLVYGRDDIFTVTSNFGYQTVIELDENEKIVTLSLGNANIFKIIPAQNRLFIKAQQNGFTTNMTVITNVRTYQFELSSIVDKPEDVMYVVRFIYPDVISKETSEAGTSTSAPDSTGPMQLYSPISLPNVAPANPVRNSVNNVVAPYSNVPAQAVGSFNNIGINENTVPSVSHMLNFNNSGPGGNGGTDNSAPLSLQYKNLSSAPQYINQPGSPRY